MIAKTATVHFVATLQMQHRLSLPTLRVLDNIKEQSTDIRLQSLATEI